MSALDTILSADGLVRTTKVHFAAKNGNEAYDKMCEVGGNPHNKRYDIANNLHMDHGLMPEYLKRNIKGFFVEFHQPAQQGGKPRVTFKFRVSKVDTGVQELRLSMEFAVRDAPHASLEGYCQLLELEDEPSATEHGNNPEVPTAMFQFKWLTKWTTTLNDVVNLINNGVQVYDPPGDLEEYHGKLSGFRYQTYKGRINGYRDWCSQVFVRLYALGWVDRVIQDRVWREGIEEDIKSFGNALQITPGKPQTIFRWDLRSPEFQDVITFYFQRGPNNNLMWHPELMWHGKFDDSTLKCIRMMPARSGEDPRRPRKLQYIDTPP